MPSTITTPVAFRLPNEVLAIIERRIKGKRSRWKTVGEYLMDRTIYDLTRPHKKKSREKGDL